MVRRGKPTIPKLVVLKRIMVGGRVIMARTKQKSDVSKEVVIYQELLLLRMNVVAIQERMKRELRALEDRIIRLIPPEESDRRPVTREDLIKAARKKGKNV